MADGTEPMTITREPDGRVRMANGGWSMTVTRGAVRAGQPGPWARFYAGDVAALEAFMRQHPVAA